METAEVPEPLRRFMAVYLHPEVAGKYWQESVQSHFDSDPARAELIREQLDEVIRTKSIPLESYIALTKDHIDSQEELDQWLVILRERIAKS